MSTTIFENTKKRSSKSKAIFAFGRDTELCGKPNSEGGFFVFKFCLNHNSNSRGGLSGSWRCVNKKPIQHQEAIELMNKRLGRIVWEATEAAC